MKKERLKLLERMWMTTDKVEEGENRMGGTGRRQQEKACGDVAQSFWVWSMITMGKTDNR